VKREHRWAFLWLEYSRIGYVERLDLFGFNLYYRSGSLVKILGYEWIEK
jgi:hypothetical protein